LVQEQNMASRTVTRTLAVAGALAVVVAGCSRQPQATPTPAPTSQPVAAPAADPKRYPVTTANGNGPPGERPSPDHHGNGALWTMLPSGGIDRSGTLESDGSISQKFFWWTVGTTGELTIQGRRVDDPAPPLRARIGSGVPKPPSPRSLVAASGPAGSPSRPRVAGRSPAGSDPPA
jgi:hypothetical protein